MLFFSIIEAAVITFLLLVGFTQIFLPVLKGTKLFPFFRQRDLNDQLKEAHSEIEEEQIKQDIARLQKRAESLRRIREEEDKEDETGNGNFAA